MSIKSSNRTFVNLIGIPGILALLWMGGSLFGIFIAVVIIIAIRCSCCTWCQPAKPKKSAAVVVSIPPQKFRG